MRPVYSRAAWLVAAFVDVLVAAAVFVSPIQLVEKLVAAYFLGMAFVFAVHGMLLADKKVLIEDDGIIYMPEPI
jgi:hypothetical protein